MEMTGVLTYIGYDASVNHLELGINGGLVRAKLVDKPVRIDDLIRILWKLDPEYRARMANTYGNGMGHNFVMINGEACEITFYHEVVGCRYVYSMRYGGDEDDQHFPVENADGSKFIVSMSTYGAIMWDGWMDMDKLYPLMHEWALFVRDEWWLQQRVKSVTDMFVRNHDVDTHPYWVDDYEPSVGGNIVSPYKNSLYDDSADGVSPGTSLEFDYTGHGRTVSCVSIANGSLTLDDDGWMASDDMVDCLYGVHKMVEISDQLPSNVAGLRELACMWNVFDSTVHIAQISKPNALKWGLLHRQPLYTQWDVPRWMFAPGKFDDDGLMMTRYNYIINNCSHDLGIITIKHLNPVTGLWESGDYLFDYVTGKIVMIGVNPKFIITAVTALARIHPLNRQMVNANIKFDSIRAGVVSQRTVGTSSITLASVRDNKWTIHY